MKFLERVITVTNPRGVHSRIASGLALIAREHGVRLEIVRGADRCDCSSILDVLSMALVKGSLLTVRVEGEAGQAAAALSRVEHLLAIQDE